MSPRITLCLIARDEEAMLPACLESAREAVDEIVLVDTGSSDRTRDIARAAGARVAEQAWQGDFCPPRNEALRLATGDWILQLDCDERLAPGAGRELRAEVARPGPPAGLLALHDAARLDAAPEEVVSGRARLGEPLWVPRLLRRLPDLAWSGYDSVTDWLVAHGSRARRVRADIVHLGAVPGLRASRGKRERNIAYLEGLARERPHDLPVSGLLAQELLAAGRLAEARQEAERGWAALDLGAGRLLLRLATARALLQLEAADAGGALATVRLAEARDGAHPDTSWLAGQALEQLAARSADPAERRRLLAEAEGAHRRARALRGTALSDASVRGASSWLPLAGLGRTLLGLGRPAEAARAFEEALAELPDLAEARLGLCEARLDAGDPAGALALAEPLLAGGPDAWVLAAAAALALGARGDARLFLETAAEREGKGFVSQRLRERYGELREEVMGASTPTATATPAAASSATAASTPAATETPTPAATPAAGRKLAVTIVSPEGYPHSAGFREVAEALHHGLRALGCDSVLGTDLDLPGRRHLVLGANLLAAARRAPPPGAILYNLEQVQEGSPWFGPELLELYRRHEVWDYSRANVEALARMGVPRPRLVPVGYAPELCRIAPAQEDIDVLFYGSMNDRRRALLEELARRGARVHAAFGVYGEERDRLVARSRLVLNVHFYEAKVFEVVRVSYLLANRRAVVSERGCDAEEEGPFERAVAFAPYERLADTCLDLLRRPEERRRLGEEGHAVMAARPQSAYLEAALRG